MKAEIFALGTELLMGELVDTNSAWLAARLPALGIDPSVPKTHNAGKITG